LATVSDNFAILANAGLMQSWDALESNRMMTRCPTSKNVHISTSSPLGISSTMVCLTQTLLDVAPRFGLSAELPLMRGLLVLCPSLVHDTAE
jgi:hypothetical protein